MVTVDNFCAYLETNKLWSMSVRRILARILSKSHQQLAKKLSSVTYVNTAQLRAEALEAFKEWIAWTDEDFDDYVRDTILCDDSEVCKQRLIKAFSDPGRRSVYISRKVREAVKKLDMPEDVLDIFESQGGWGYFDEQDRNIIVKFISSIDSSKVRFDEIYNITTESVKEDAYTSPVLIDMHKLFPGDFCAPIFGYDQRVKAYNLSTSKTQQEAREKISVLRQTYPHIVLDIHYKVKLKLE